MTPEKMEQHAARMRLQNFQARLRAIRQSSMPRTKRERALKELWEQAARDRAAVGRMPKPPQVRKRPEEAESRAV